MKSEEIQYYKTIEKIAFQVVSGNFADLNIILSSDGKALMDKDEDTIFSDIFKAMVKYMKREHLQSKNKIDDLLKVIEKSELYYSHLQKQSGGMLLDEQKKLKLLKEGEYQKLEIIHLEQMMLTILEVNDSNLLKSFIDTYQRYIGAKPQVQGFCVMLLYYYKKMINRSELEKTVNPEWGCVEDVYENYLIEPILMLKK